MGLKHPGHAHNLASPRAQRKSRYLHFSPAADAEGGGASPTHSVYRCIVTGSHNPGLGEGSEVILDALQRLWDPQVWIILMRSGGHFAGAVFRG